MSLRVALTAFAAILGASALAEPIAAAPRAKAGQLPATVEVINRRSVVLANLALFAPGEDGKPIAKLAKPVPPEGKAVLKLTKAKGCEFVARWEFEDAADEAPVDLCHHQQLVLSE